MPSKIYLKSQELNLDPVARRRLALETSLRHGSLYHFIPWITPQFAPPVHLKPLVDVLHRIGNGEAVRALVSVPPRHGKTETLLHTIAWYLWNHPDKTCGYVSYEATFAWGRSHKARAVARKAGVELSKAQKSKAEWRTEMGGGCLATGIGGPLTGHGLDFGIVDDPFKNREDAESELMRQKAFDWFTDTFYTRLQPNSSAIVNMARWHQDDLIGRLEADKSKKWEVITLPAIDDQGNALWPEVWPVDALNEKRLQVGSYGWESLYQGRPSNRAGSVFQRRWMQNRYSGEFTYTQAQGGWTPNNISLTHKIISVDGAWKDGVGKDFSVVQVWGMDAQHYYLIDQWRARVEVPDLKQAVIDMYWKHKPQAVVIEDSASGIAVIQMLRRETSLPVTAVSAKTSKVNRADIVAPLFEAGRVKLPAKAHFVSDYIDEMCAFPNGTHDDQVDATTIGLTRLLNQREGHVVDLFSRKQYNLPQDIYQR